MTSDESFEAYMEEIDPCECMGDMERSKTGHAFGKGWDARGAQSPWVEIDKIPDEWKKGQPVAFRFPTVKPFSDEPNKVHYHYEIGVFVTGHELDAVVGDLFAWSFEARFCDADSADMAKLIDLTEMGETA